MKPPTPAHLAALGPVTEGPRFQIQTWSVEVEPHGTLWFARAIPIRAESAPHVDAGDLARSALSGDGRPVLADAVRAAVVACVGAYFTNIKVRRSRKAVR